MDKRQRASVERRDMKNSPGRSRWALALLWAFVSFAFGIVAEAQEARPIDGIAEHNRF